MKKDIRWRSKKYIDWVKSQPSIISGNIGCDPHHIKGHYLTGGVTAPDWAVIPLTRIEHTDLHNIGYKAWEEKHGISQVDLLMIFWRDNFNEIKGFF